MRARHFPLLVPFLVLPVAFAWSAGAPRATAVADEGPLVIELFTSQGCSSCPPADALLDRLARGPLEGRALAPLSFHVDYWDDLGWPDPFAAPAWTERQRTYARALGDRGVYTPQLVIGGAVGLVGSQERAVTRAIAAAPRPARLPVDAAWAEGVLTLTATAPADADVFVALYQDGTRTAVPRGENAGATLAASRVVRRLVRVAAAGTRATARVPIEAGWARVGAVVFAQRADRRIVASAQVAP